MDQGAGGGNDRPNIGSGGPEGPPGKKVLGMEAMLDIFETAGYGREGVQWAEVDVFPFNNHRGGVWAAMREIYPTRPDLTTRTGPLLKDDEPPAPYVHAQLRRWRVMTE